MSRAAPDDRRPGSRLAEARRRRRARRVDKHVLRWQARLDGAWADRVVPYVAAVVLFAVLATLSLARLRSLDSPLALAEATQAAWLVGEGGPYEVSLDGGDHVLARQAAFVMVPLGYVGRFVPLPPFLLVVQAAALAFGVVPLWRIGRVHAQLRVGAVAAVVVAYGLFPVLHDLNLSGFHPEVLGLPALLGAMHFALGARWRPFAACAALAVLSRADLGFAVAGIGVLLVLTDRRRAGARTIVAGVGWTALCGLVIQPLVSDGTPAHLDTFSAYGDTVWSVAWGVLTRPGDVLRDLTAPDNLDLAVRMLAPLLFLPLLSPRYLVGVVPLQAVYLVADVPRADRFGQQTVAVTAFAFLALTFTLASLGKRGIERVTVDGRLLGVLVMASALLFAQQAPTSPYSEPWDWGAEDATDVARRAAADLVPGGVAVRVSDTMALLVAEREVVLLVPAEAQPDAGALAAGVDALLLDHADLDWTPPDWARLRRDLGAAGFERRHVERGIELWVAA